MSHRFAVMLVVESDDPVLAENQIIAAMDSSAGVARMRQAVLTSLPESVQRLVAVFPEHHAKALLLLHDAIGEHVTGEPIFAKPPASYVPPTRE